MSVPNPDSSGVVDRTTDRVGGPPSRYDFVLAVIPVALMLAAVARTVGVVAFYDAMLAGSIVGAAALVDALFVNPPRDST